MVVDSAPNFQFASRDAALVAFDREKDVALYEPTIRSLPVVGEFRKSVDPGIAGQFALRCRPVWPAARWGIQVISLDGGRAAFRAAKSICSGSSIRGLVVVAGLLLHSFGRPAWIRWIYNPLIVERCQSTKAVQSTQPPDAWWEILGLDPRLRH